MSIEVDLKRILSEPEPKEPLKLHGAVKPGSNGTVSFSLYEDQAWVEIPLSDIDSIKRVACKSCGDKANPSVELTVKASRVEAIPAYAMLAQILALIERMLKSEPIAQTPAPQTGPSNQRSIRCIFCCGSTSEYCKAFCQPGS